MYKKFSNRFGDVIDKVDDRILKKKITKAVDMMEKGDAEQIRRKFDKMDKNELMEKLDKIDKNKLESLNIDTKEISKRITEEDYKKFAQILGKDSKDVIDKIKKILNQ